ncbi:MAG: hypothetical protein CMN78_05525 [Spirochaetales bacterium]|nr:hypothetical protein [Spirochaetales bacterium]
MVVDNWKRRITLSIPETAEISGLSIPTVNRRILDGTLPSLKIGGRRLIPVAELEKYITKHTTAEIL